MSILFNELSEALDTGIKGLFENILEFFSNEPLIDWLDDLHYVDLMRVSHTLDKVAQVRRQINENGKKDLFQDMFLNSFYTLAGKNKPNILEETIKLKKELNAFYRNPKVPRYIKLLSRFDLPSLEDVVKTINGIINIRLHPNSTIPSAKKLERVERERIKEKQERQKEQRKRKKRTEEEIKQAKATDFEKLKGDRSP